MGAHVWDSVRLIAHRCGGHLAPENALAGLQAAAGLGVRAVEFDVMLSADGVPFLMHDYTLERTVLAEGRLVDLPASRISTLRLKPKGDFGAECVPRLVDALAVCQALGLAANIELKPAPEDAVRTGEVVGRLLADIARQGDGGNSWLLSSFSADALAAARRHAPTLRAAWLCEAVSEEALACRRQLGCQDLHCAWQAADATLAAALHAQGGRLRCYTVNAADTARTLLRAGIDAVFSDALAEMLALPECERQPG